MSGRGPIPPPVQVSNGSQSYQNLEFGYSNYDEEHFIYPRCKYKGYVLIISNDAFTYSEVANKRRTGSVYDKEELCRTLGQLGFYHIDVKDNLTVKEIQHVLSQTARKDFSEFGCLIIAIFSYGEDFKVYGTDDRLTYQQLINPFTFDKVPSLNDKPKLFIIQTECPDSSRLTHDAPVPPVLASKVIKEPDVLVAYSHDSERISWRTGGRGTWFIQSLCEVLNYDWRRLDLMSMLTRVNFLVRQYYESYVADRAASAYCPRLISLLTKRFQLFTPADDDMEVDMEH